MSRMQLPIWVSLVLLVRLGIGACTPKKCDKLEQEIKAVDLKIKNEQSQLNQIIQSDHFQSRGQRFERYSSRIEHIEGMKRLTLDKLKAVKELLALKKIKEAAIKQLAGIQPSEELNAACIKLNSSIELDLHKGKELIKEFDQFVLKHQVLSDELKRLEKELQPLISQINEKKQLIDELKDKKNELTIELEEEKNKLAIELEEEKNKLTIELEEEKNELAIELKEKNRHVELEEENYPTKLEENDWPTKLEKVIQDTIACKISLEQPIQKNPIKVDNLVNCNQNITIQNLTVNVIGRGDEDSEINISKGNFHSFDSNKEFTTQIHDSIDGGINRSNVSFNTNLSEKENLPIRRSSNSQIEQQQEKKKEIHSEKSIFEETIHESTNSSNDLPGLSIGSSYREDKICEGSNQKNNWKTLIGYSIGTVLATLAIGGIAHLLAK